MTFMQEVAADFTAETKDHQLTVLHDDGLYRHLRIAAPFTGIWSWELVTWPGHLAITGDIGSGYTFHADEDMVPWFLASRTINPRYWAEKLPERQRRVVFEFDPELLRQAALKEIAEWRLADSDRDAAIAQLNTAWEDVWAEDENEYRGVIDRYVLEATTTTGDVLGGSEFRFPDAAEMDGEEFSRSYLLACNAIHFGLRLYAAKGTP